MTSKHHHRNASIVSQPTRSNTPALDAFLEQEGREYDEQELEALSTPSLSGSSHSSLGGSEGELVWALDKPIDRVQSMTGRIISVGKEATLFSRTGSRYTFALDDLPAVERTRSLVGLPVDFQTSSDRASRACRVRVRWAEVLLQVMQGTLPPATLPEGLWCSLEGKVVAWDNAKARGSVEVWSGTLKAVIWVSDAAMDAADRATVSGGFRVSLDLAGSAESYRVVCMRISWRAVLEAYACKQSPTSSFHQLLAPPPVEKSSIDRSRPQSRRPGRPPWPSVGVIVELEMRNGTGKLRVAGTTELLFFKFSTRLQESERGDFFCAATVFFWRDARSSQVAAMLGRARLDSARWPRLKNLVHANDEEMGFSKRMQNALDSREQRGMLRRLREEPSDLCDFSSNDYLSLAQCPSLRERFRESLGDGQVLGPPSSRLLDGNSPSHTALEDRLASFFCAESALLFNSGYDANSGLWQCLPAEFDVIVYDELVHASTHDGMRLSRCNRRIPFAHNSSQALEAVLSRLVSQDERIADGSRDVWVSVESLYSMDGDLAPLDTFVNLIERLLPAGNGHLVVDEAHATGLYGQNGRGRTCELGLANKVLIRVHTFGKSLACSGAVVLSTPLIRSYLINYARPLIYSTVMPHFGVHAINCGLDVLEQGQDDWRAAHVHRLAAHLMSHLLALPVTPYATLPTPAPSISSPIVPIISCQALELAAHLRSAGYLVRALRFPTVPVGGERVRITLHAANTFEQVDGLIAALRHWLAERNVKPEFDRIELPADALPLSARL